MSDLPGNQQEPTLITTSLNVERIEDGLYRSLKLWQPPNTRGVFGGQVISQACVSATNCIDTAFALHSIHCYFLASADPREPILYHVDRLRTGRTYITCSVKAVQRGAAIFMMLCSFQKPEPWQPSYAWPMPKVPHPDECETVENIYRQYAAAADDKRVQLLYTARAAERRRSPIETRAAQLPQVGEDKPYMYWMKAKRLESYDASYQKCILGYISDLDFLPTASRVLGLVRYAKGPNALSMNSSLDHTIHFYNNDFHCGEWLLYVISSPRVGSGRGVVYGRMYTEAGVLVAVVSQEGVVRADRRPSDVQAKL